MIQTIDGQVMPLVYQMKASQPTIQKRSDRAEATLHSLVDTLLTPINTARSRDGWRGYVFMDPLFKNPSPLVPMYSDQPAAQLMPYQSSESAPIPYVVDPPPDMHMSSSDRYSTRTKHYPEPEDLEEEKGLKSASLRKRVPSEVSTKTTPSSGPAISIGHSPGGGTSIRLGKAQITFKKGSISLGPVEETHQEASTASSGNKKASSNHRQRASSSAKIAASPSDYDETRTNRRHRSKRPKTGDEESDEASSESDGEEEEAASESPDPETSEDDKDPAYKASASGYYHSYKPYQPGRDRGRGRGRNYSLPPLYPDPSDDRATSAPLPATSQAPSSSQKTSRNKGKRNRSAGSGKLIQLDDYEDEVDNGSHSSSRVKSKSKSQVVEDDYDGEEDGNQQPRRGAEKKTKMRKTTPQEQDDGDDFYVKPVSPSPEVSNYSDESSIGKKREKKTTKSQYSDEREEESEARSRAGNLKSDSNDYNGEEQNRRKRKTQHSNLLSRHLPREHRMEDDFKSSDEPIVSPVNRSASKAKNTRNTSQNGSKSRKSKSKPATQIVKEDNDESDSAHELDEPKVQPSSSSRARKTSEKVSNPIIKLVKDEEDIYFTSTLSKGDVTSNKQSKRGKSQSIKQSAAGGAGSDKVELEDTILTVKMPNEETVALKSDRENVYQIRLTSRVAPIKETDEVEVAGSDKQAMNGKNQATIDLVSMDSEKKADEKALRQLIQMMQDTLVDIKKTSQTSVTPCPPPPSTSSSPRTGKLGKSRVEEAGSTSSKANDASKKDRETGKKVEHVDRDSGISVIKPFLEGSSMSELMRMLIKGTKSKGNNSDSDGKPEVGSNEKKPQNSSATTTASSDTEFIKSQVRDKSELSSKSEDIKSGSGGGGRSEEKSSSSDEKSGGEEEAKDEDERNSQPSVFLTERKTGDGSLMAKNSTSADGKGGEEIPIIVVLLPPQDET